jgi:hypothetical protein
METEQEPPISDPAKPKRYLDQHRYPCIVCHEYMEDGTFTRTKNGFRLRHKDCVEL